MMDLDFETLVSTAAIPSVTWLGCVTAYVFSEQKGLKGSRKFLEGFFPKRSDSFYFRFDFIISVIIGTCIGIILYSPKTGYQALAAGIGWTAAFSIIRAEKANPSGRDS